MVEIAHTTELCLHQNEHKHVLVFDLLEPRAILNLVSSTKSCNIVTVLSLISSFLAYARSFARAASFRLGKSLTSIESCHLEVGVPAKDGFMLKGRNRRVKFGIRNGTMCTATRLKYIQRSCWALRRSQYHGPALKSNEKLQESNTESSSRLSCHLLLSSIIYRYAMWPSVLDDGAGWRSMLWHPTALAIA